LILTSSRDGGVIKLRSELAMLSSDENENKPIGNPGRRKEKAERQNKQDRKAAPRSRKGTQQQEAKPDQLPPAQEQVEEQVGGQVEEQVEEQVSEAMSAAVISGDSAAMTVSPTDAPVVGPAETVPVTVQTLANAYGNYSRTSLEQTRSFFEKLADVRSPDRAFALQTEFARKAFQTFEAESRRIGALHGQLAEQRLKRFQLFLARMTEAAFNPAPRS
jgi:hypothetical protein